MIMIQIGAAFLVFGISQSAADFFFSEWQMRRDEKRAQPPPPPPVRVIKPSPFRVVYENEDDDAR